MSKELTVLVAKLKEKQGDRTDTAFVKELGISRALWFLIKNGYREPGIKFINAVMGKYPDLMLDVMNYLRAKQSTREEDPAIGNGNHEQEAVK